MEEVICNLCHGNDLVSLYKGSDNLFASPCTYQLMRCRKCGLVFVNPRPKDMKEYYSDRVHNIVDDGFAFLNPDRLALIERFKKKGRILDVACGHGYFLSDMHKGGWEVYGNELSLTGCAFARETLGLQNISYGDLLSLELPGGTFDVVTMWHTLEHMSRPKETLERIRMLLKDDGVLVVEVPDFSNPQCRIFKDKCQGIDLPRHLYHFTPLTLKRMLKAAGFRIVKKDYFVNPRITFVTLKFSFLRIFGFERPVVKGQEASVLVPGPEKGFLWKSLRFAVNVMFLGTAFVLELLHCDLSMRVYCRKEQRV